MEAQTPQVSGTVTTSLHGNLCPIFVPTHLGFDNPREISKALLAWRYNLSREHIQTLELLAIGLSNTELSMDLRVDEQTVKNRIQTITKNMSVKNRTQAAVVAALYGLGNEALPKGSENSPNRIA